MEIDDLTARIYNLSFAALSMLNNIWYIKYKWQMMKSVMSLKYD